jgi:hypothetical protein
MPSSYDPYRSTWTNDPIVPGDQPGPTRVRRIHVDELRTALEWDITARGGARPTWTDTLTAGATKIRAVHLNELRNGVSALVARLSPCGTNTAVASFTAPNPMVDTVNKIRAVHIQELRYIISTAEAACYCDCVGHCSCVSHSYCSCAGMAHCCCQDHSL